LAAIRPGALLAELLGTFVLAGVVLNWATQNTTGSLAVALVLAVLVSVFGVVSGGHLNPAITVAQWVNRKIDGVKATMYIIAQVLGAVLALVVLTGLNQANFDRDAAIISGVEVASQGQVTAQAIADAGGINEWAAANGFEDTAGLQKTLKDQYNIETEKAPAINERTDLTKNKEWVVFLSEIIGALVFGLGVGYAVFSSKRSRIEAGLAVGLGLFAGLVIGGASVILNPAVAGAVGGFVAHNPFTDGALVFWWPVIIYVGGTVIGMTLGVTIYRYILKDALEGRNNEE
jgi:glycerol uptake facilitator-like aquaporin